MMSRIERIRRAELIRRASKPETDETSGTEDANVVNLPVAVGAARTVPPRNSDPQGEAAFAAQLLGQEGQKRGLRAGQELFDAAKSSYVRTEWSGAKDRR